MVLKMTFPLSNIVCEKINHIQVQTPEITQKKGKMKNSKKKLQYIQVDTIVMMQLWHTL
jgi:hypothetical protein